MPVEQLTLEGIWQAKLRMDASLRKEDSISCMEMSDKTLTWIAKQMGIDSAKQIKEGKIAQSLYGIKICDNEYWPFGLVSLYDSGGNLMETMKVIEYFPEVKKMESLMDKIRNAFNFLRTGGKQK